VIIPSAMHGTHAQVKKKAKKVMALLHVGVGWNDALEGNGTDNTFWPIVSHQGLISFHSTRKSERLYFVDAFAEVASADLALARFYECPEDDVGYYDEHVNIKALIFEESLLSAWGVIFLSVFDWSTQMRVTWIESEKLHRTERFYNFQRIREYLTGLLTHWDKINSLGKNFCGLTDAEDYFWQCGNQPKASLLHLGVPQSRTDAVFGTVYEQESTNRKNFVSQSDFSALVTEALETSENFPNVGLAQVPMLT
jgi:hypothetical protein